MYTLGGVCAFFPNIYLPDKFGRRWAMFICNALQVWVSGSRLAEIEADQIRTGAIITANARNMDMLLFGRWLSELISTAFTKRDFAADTRAPAGLGTAASATAAKSYLAEITPNRSRGRYMGEFSSCRREEPLIGLTFFLGVQNSFYYVGQILATGITVSHPDGRLDGGVTGQQSKGSCSPANLKLTRARSPLAE